MSLNKEAYRISFLTPYYKQSRGNSTTAKRIVKGLRESGFEVFVYAYNESPLTEDVKEQLANSDLYHILHFSRFNNWLSKHNFVINKPYILTSGGTDVNQDIFNTQQKESLNSIIMNAESVTVFTNDGKEKIVNVFSGASNKVKVIPQSVWFPSEEKEVSSQLPSGYPKILLPAGLREVKDVLFLINELAELQTYYSELRFLIIGTVLDAKVYKEVKAYCDEYPWMSLLTDVDFEEVKSFYKWSDFVLNTSISEGQSISILEAMECGKVVFARKNAGNESIVSNKENGFIFRNGNEFKTQIKNLLENPSEEERIRKNAKKFVEQRHHFSIEINQYIQVYRHILESNDE